MTLLTSMLDFSDTGEIGTLVSKESVAAREAAIGKGGLHAGQGARASPSPRCAPTT